MEVAKPLVEEGARVPRTDSVLVPTTDPGDLLFTVVVAEELNPKVPFPVLPTAEELPKEVLPRLPNPAS